MLFRRREEAKARTEINRGTKKPRYREEEIERNRIGTRTKKGGEGLVSRGEKTRAAS